MTLCLSRLAPSPTGALHLGNARTFLINWALAHQNEWRLILRIEDLDGPRIQPGAQAQVIEILNWLGIDYEEPVLVQSADMSPYEDVIGELSARDAIFACQLSRSEIQQAASAPHQDSHELRFSPNLRPEDSIAYSFSHPDQNYRLMVPDQEVTFEDGFAGLIKHHPHQEVGDFVVWTKRGVPAYQLAVVVDDARQGITDVVRADDLLPSTARQILIYQALGWKIPRFWHFPLVCGPDGRRLAKRHGDTRLTFYRDAGVHPERIIGLLAFWSGIVEHRTELTANDFRNGFQLSKVSHHAITFTQEDHQWLMAETSPISHE